MKAKGKAFQCSKGRKPSETKLGDSSSLEVRAVFLYHRNFLQQLQKVSISL